MEIKNLYAKLKCSHIRLRILSISIILLLLLSSISVITTDVSGERTEFLLPDESNCLDTSNSRWKPDTEVLDQSEREFETARARTGAQSFAVICVHFHDLPPPANTRWTRAEIEDIMSTINDLWYNISYGKITISYQVEGWYDLGNNRAAYPNNLKDNWRGIVQEAVNLADDDINFWNFDYVLVWINQALGAPDNGFWRGVSSVGSNVLITMDDSPIPFFPFKVVGASLVGENPIESESTVWGRTAHEMGHAFGLQHTHENYNSDYSLMARAYPSDLNVYSQLVGGTEWFPTSSNEMIVEQGDQGSWVLRPRSIDFIGDLQSLKVEISGSKYYQVEVVRLWSEDAWRWDEGVLIYEVDDSKTKNACVDKRSPSGYLWKENETYIDTTHDITIDIIQEIGDGFRISVANDVGDPDLYIIPWGDPPGHPPPYETRDIWVDSKVNGWNWYRYRDSNGNPVDVGDDPWANNENRLHARIRNIGGANAYDVVVNFYYKDYSAGGVDWIDIDSTTIEQISGHSSVDVWVPWTPAINLQGQPGLHSYHACVWVEIESVDGEVTVDNNQAWENIGRFEIVVGQAAALAQITGNFLPITVDFVIGNPLFNGTPTYVGIMNMSLDWYIEDIEAIVGDHSIQYLDEKDFSMTLIPLSGVEFGTELEASVIMGYLIDDDLDGALDGFIGDLTLAPYSGLTLVGTAMYSSSIGLSASVNYDTITLAGSLILDTQTPSIHYPWNGEDKFILLELENETGHRLYEVVELDANGDFSFSFTGLDVAEYTPSAYFAGSRIVAGSYNTVDALQTSEPPNLVLIAVGAAIVLLLVLVLVVRIRR